MEGFYSGPSPFLPGMAPPGAAGHPTSQILHPGLVSPVLATEIARCSSTVNGAEVHTQLLVSDIDRQLLELERQRERELREIELEERMWLERRRRNTSPERSYRHRDSSSEKRYRDWDRSRDRSRDRERSRSRDRGRERRRRRHRDRSRSRKRSRSRGKSTEKSGKNDTSESSASDRREKRERSSSRSHGRRTRSRSYDRRSRDRSRSREYERRRHQPEPPHHTIMVRGLPCHITEENLHSQVSESGLKAKDIRLMRKKDTGQSRGFAFVEFATIEEAVKWMEHKKGVVSFGSDCRVDMHYSIPKDGRLGKPSSSGPSLNFQDWDCTKCGVHNFRKREFCFKCNASRAEVGRARVADGQDEISINPCNTLLFRNLDPLTTEGKVLEVLAGLSAPPIKTIRIAKDPITNISRGFCYVEMNSTAEAVQLYEHLVALGVPLYVNNRLIGVSYAKQPLSCLSSSTCASVASAAVAAAQWTNQVTHNAAAVAAAAAAAQLAGYGQDYSGYQYYSQSTDPAVQQYYQQQTAASDSKGGSQVTITGAPVAASDSNAPAVNTASIGQPTADGQYTRYQPPDVTTYRYDESSGYYYDPYTGLYYDANTQYYYNGESQQFLYWDGDKSTYLPAPTSSDTNGDNKDPDKKKDKEKHDKVKIAKKIAKDMERWAKTLNQKKEFAKQGVVAQAGGGGVDGSRQSATADAGFAVLEKKATPADRLLVLDALKKRDEAPTASGGALVPAYGSGSDSEEDDSAASRQSSSYQSELTDWSKLACLLCKRQFPSRDALLRHQQLSDLHKQNLAALKDKMTAEQAAELDRNEAKYRDRAKERRQKYGQGTNEPRTSKLKENYMKQVASSYEQPTKLGIKGDNIGNKMLKAMGWSEGQGLGKTNQGRTDPIDAERRATSAGLGARGSTYGSGTSDSYREAVLKMTQARYQELEK